MSSTPLSLVCHAHAPCAAVRSIEVMLLAEHRCTLRLRYTVRGELALLRLPSAHSPAPDDRLWAHTCCELFVAGRGDTAYREWNFSPSGQSAQYGFSAYRVRRESGSTVVATTAPLLQIAHDAHALHIDACVALPAELGDALQIGLSAVIEDAQGTLSYWALRHAPGKPDFHHRDAFALAFDLAPSVSGEQTA